MAAGGGNVLTPGDPDEMRILVRVDGQRLGRPFRETVGNLDAMARERQARTAEESARG